MNIAMHFFKYTKAGFYSSQFMVPLYLAFQYNVLTILANDFVGGHWRWRLLSLHIS
uniref:Uncharacterized protein n=1 Tax=Parascaris equorum TaxID=6256 RepID=A0A914RB11_PAREQ